MKFCIGCREDKPSDEFINRICPCPDDQGICVKCMKKCYRTTKAESLILTCWTCNQYYTNPKEIIETASDKKIVFNRKHIPEYLVLDICIPWLIFMFKITYFGIRPLILLGLYLIDKDEIYNLLIIENIVLFSILAYKTYTPQQLNKSDILIEFTSSTICKHLIVYFEDGKMEIIQLFTNSFIWMFYFNTTPTLIEFISLIILHRLQSYKITSMIPHISYIDKCTTVFHTLFELYCIQFYFRCLMYMISNPVEIIPPTLISNTQVNLLPLLIVLITIIYYFYYCVFNYIDILSSQFKSYVNVSFILSIVFVSIMKLYYDIDIYLALLYISFIQYILVETFIRYEIVKVLSPFIILMGKSAVNKTLNFDFLLSLVSNTNKLTNEQWAKIVHNILIDKNNIRIKFNAF